ncbi:hypothetical protein C4K68_14300 [Pokkaliibacter plantistimulans]|uniref:Uncharacterized protein n=1 Tax=Proteobacteria bacterium 228 TaxID=2083153 RepID=A0A2S5KPF4_9PROT|nr:hypothetical protein [Pokkaliibacter plantistimulans]PPC76658.1 hypothetical protein C4K68_14300 [Pokkaliibacter plantistimulans]
MKNTLDYLALANKAIFYLLLCYYLYYAFNDVSNGIRTIPSSYVVFACASLLPFALFDKLCKKRKKTDDSVRLEAANPAAQTSPLPLSATLNYLKLYALLVISKYGVLAAFAYTAYLNLSMDPPVIPERQSVFFLIVLFLLVISESRISKKLSCSICNQYLLKQKPEFNILHAISLLKNIKSRQQVICAECSTHNSDIPTR